jgi:hypothetical protein
VASFDVLLKDVADEALAPLLTEIARAGFTSPIVTPSGINFPADTAPASVSTAVELPEDWRIIDERDSVSYAWPEDTDHYDAYRVYAGDTADGTVRAAVGWTFSQRWGGERHQRCAPAAARGVRRRR